MENSVMILVAMVMLLLAALAIVGKQLDKVTHERNIIKEQLEELKKHYVYGDKN